MTDSGQKRAFHPVLLLGAYFTRNLKFWLQPRIRPHGDGTRYLDEGYGSIEVVK